MVLPRLQLLSTGSDLRSTSPPSVTHGRLTRVRNFRVGGGHKINNTRGISSIIVFGNEIPLIRCELIEELKYRFSLDNIPKAEDRFEVGMNTEVITGPFAQLIGKIEKIDADQRIWILLDILGTQTRVSINKLNLTPPK